MQGKNNTRYYTMRQFVLVVCILCTSFLSANDKIIWKEVQVPVYEIVDTNFIAFLDSCYAVASQRTWWDSAQVIDIYVSQLIEYDRMGDVQAIWALKSDLVEPVMRDKYAYETQLSALNRIGTHASDFRFMDKSGDMSKSNNCASTYASIKVSA